MLKIASLLLTYAGFALFQGVAERQPLAARVAHLGRHARTGARSIALATVFLACLVLVPTMGWTEACLLTAVELTLVAGLFILVAPVVPRLAWRLALVAPPIAGMLVLLGSWTS